MVFLPITNMHNSLLMSDVEKRLFPSSALNTHEKPLCLLFLARTHTQKNLPLRLFIPHYASCSSYFTLMITISRRKIFRRVYYLRVWVGECGELGTFFFSSSTTSSKVLYYVLYV